MHLLSAGVAEFITQLCHEDPENAEMSNPKVYSKITKDPTEVSLTVVIETMTRETNYSTMSEHYEPNYNVTTLNINFEKLYVRKSKITKTTIMPLFLLQMT